MPRICCVMNCESKYTNEGKNRTYFKFPTDPEHKRKWLESIGCNLDTRKSFYKERYICDLHFEESDIARNAVLVVKDGEEIDLARKRVRLKAKSVPSVFKEENGEPYYKRIEQTRRINFAPSEKQLLLALVKKYSVIESKDSTARIHERKNEAWTQVHSEFNSLAETGATTMKQLKALYTHLKREMRFPRLSHHFHEDSLYEIPTSLLSIKEDVLKSDTPHPLPPLIYVVESQDASKSDSTNSIDIKEEISDLQETSTTNVISCCSVEDTCESRTNSPQSSSSQALTESNCAVISKERKHVRRHRRKQMVRSEALRKLYYRKKIEQLEKQEKIQNFINELTIKKLRLEIKNLQKYFRVFQSQLHKMGE